MLTLTVRIEIGNSGMETSEHVVAALRGVANRLEDKGYIEDLDLLERNKNLPLTRGIMDRNGNTVGEWTFQEEQDPMVQAFLPDHVKVGGTTLRLKDVPPPHNHFGEVFMPDTCPGCKHMQDNKDK